MKNLKERVKSLKDEIVQELSSRDLVGEPIFVGDPIHFPTTLVIQSQYGTGIEVEDEIGEVKEMDLRDFGIEALLDLIK